MEREQSATEGGIPPEILQKIQTLEQNIQSLEMAVSEILSAMWGLLSVVKAMLSEKEGGKSHSSCEGQGYSYPTGNNGNYLTDCMSRPYQ